jgi:hypothetical protein
MLLWRPVRHLRNVTPFVTQTTLFSKLARAMVAALLVTPWTVLSFGLFLTLPPFHRYGAFTVQFLIALFLAIVSVYGLYLVVWPPARIIRARGLGFPPDPPSGGAAVLAPLKPPPPVLILSAAKELPREDLPAADLG